MSSSRDRSGLLSICRKAGKLRVGMDMAKGACESGEAKAVFTSSDLSAKSLKEVRFVSAKTGVAVYGLDMDMDAVAAAIGKRTGIIAVSDSGFAKALAKGAKNLSADIDEFYSN